MPKSSFIEIPHHPQSLDYTCVPTCVLMVAHYHSIILSEAEIAYLLGTDETGTRFRDVHRVSALGFEVEVTTGTIFDLQKWLNAGFPCIVRIKTTHLPRYPLPPWVPHAVVVVGITENDVYIHDPAQNTAPDVVPIEVFQSAWAGGQYQFAVMKPTFDSRKSN